MAVQLFSEAGTEGETSNSRLKHLMWNPLRAARIKCWTQALMRDTSTMSTDALFLLNGRHFIGDLKQILDVGFGQCDDSLGLADTFLAVMKLIPTNWSSRKFNLPDQDKVASTPALFVGSNNQCLANSSASNRQPHNNISNSSLVINEVTPRSQDKSETGSDNPSESPCYHGYEISIHIESQAEMGVVDTRIFELTGRHIHSLKVRDISQRGLVEIRFDREDVDDMEWYWEIWNGLYHCNRLTTIELEMMFALLRRLRGFLHPDVAEDICPSELQRVDQIFSFWREEVMQYALRVPDLQKLNFGAHTQSFNIPRFIFATDPPDILKTTSKNLKMSTTLNLLRARHIAQEFLDQEAGVMSEMSTGTDQKPLTNSCFTKPLFAISVIQTFMFNIRMTLLRLQSDGGGRPYCPPPHSPSNIIGLDRILSLPPCDDDLLILFKILEVAHLVENYFDGTSCPIDWQFSKLLKGEKNSVVDNGARVRVLPTQQRAIPTNPFSFVSTVLARASEELNEIPLQELTDDDITFPPVTKSSTESEEWREVFAHGCLTPCAVLFQTQKVFHTTYMGFDDSSLVFLSPDDELIGLGRVIHCIDLCIAIIRIESDTSILMGTLCDHDEIIRIQFDNRFDLETFLNRFLHRTFKILDAKLATFLTLSSRTNDRDT